jgi:hypothetical protein
MRQYFACLIPPLFLLHFLVYESDPKVHDATFLRLADLLQIRQLADLRLAGADPIIFKRFVDLRFVNTFLRT